MNGDFDRVNWKNAAGTDTDSGRNTDINDGQVEWDGASGGYSRVRNADEEIGRATFGDSAGTMSRMRVRRNTGGQQSWKGRPRIVLQLGLPLLGCLAYSGIFGLAGLWLGGLMLMASLDAVNLHFRIFVIVLMLTTYPLVLAPVVLFQMICDKLR